MAIEITRFDPDQAPLDAPGAVIVRELTPGHTNVRFIAKQGPLLVYSSDLERGDDLEQAVGWAVNWATLRKIDRIYVEGRSSAMTFPG